MSHKLVDTTWAIGSELPPDVFRERVMAKIRANVKIDENGCWVWQKFKHPNGYGNICAGGKVWRTHRLVLTVTVRPLTDDELACHRCSNKSCCNPDHLYIGDKHINAIDKVESGTNYYRLKTHCPKGHSYAEHGYLHNGRGGHTPWRSCKLCSRIRNRIKAGWSPEEAESLAAVPPNARTARRWPSQSEGREKP